MPSFKKIIETFELKALKEVFNPGNYRNLDDKLTKAVTNQKTLTEWASTWGKRVVAFSIWGQVITSTLNPILMYFQYKNDPKITPQERRMLLTQEAAKQFVMIVLHVGVMLGFAKWFKSYLTKKATNLAEKDPELAKKIYSDVTNKIVNKDLVDAPMGLIANLAGCFAGAVLLPIVGATLFKVIDRKLGLTGGGHEHPTAEGDKKAEAPQKQEVAAVVGNAPGGNLNVVSLPAGHTAAYHGTYPVVHPNHPVHLQGSLSQPAPVAPTFQSNKPLNKQVAPSLSTLPKNAPLTLSSGRQNSPLAALR